MHQPQRRERLQPQADHGLPSSWSQLNQLEAKQKSNRHDAAVDGPTPIYCDNSGAVAVANNPVNYRHLKHVDRRHFFVQDVARSDRGGEH